LPAIGFKIPEGMIEVEKEMTVFGDFWQRDKNNEKYFPAPELYYGTGIQFSPVASLLCLQCWFVLINLIYQKQLFLFLSYNLLHQ
jgi:hypothetical protein